MRLKLPAAGTPGPGHALSTVLVDGELALDAGSLGWSLSPAEQLAVRAVFLTHAHLDHVAGLPGFLETVYGDAPPPAVYALPETLAALQLHLFNGHLMPDFVELSRVGAPFLTLHELPLRSPVHVGRHTVTAWPVAHTVPTAALAVDDGDSAIALVTDTAPTPNLVAELAAVPRLKLVLLEASFPAALAELATLTGHLTSADFLAVARQLPGVRFGAVHLKPRFAGRIEAEITAGGVANAFVARAGGEWGA